MQYNQDMLATMAEQIDLVDYIGQTEELKKISDKWYIKCPFHSNDDTPSLCIFPDNHWHCFGCGEKGNIYTWMMKYEKLTFEQAVRKVMRLTDTEGDLQLEESPTTKFLRNYKRQHQPRVPETSDRQFLDFQKDYIDVYCNELPEEWLNEDMSEEALMAYNIRVDKKSNRIVYPVFDSEDHLIGVKGRTRLKAYKEFGISKYMNYNSIGKVDYYQGWQQAYDEIQKTKTVIIFEGVKSCIKAYGWGIRNTVAAETSKLSKGQVQLLLKNKLSEVVIGFDSDQLFGNIVTDDKIQMLKRFTRVSVITNTDGLLGAKEAPVDRGKEIFERLYERRRVI